MSEPVPVGARHTLPKGASTVRARPLTLLLVFSVAISANLQGEALAGPRCTKTCKLETRRCIRADCTASRGKARRDCRERCRGAGGCTSPPIGTIAYVVSACRPASGGLADVKQELRIRRGNCDPVRISFCVGGDSEGAICQGDADCAGGACGGYTSKSALPNELCLRYAEGQDGAVSVLVGVFHRLGVSPDGSTVLFEIGRLGLPFGVSNAIDLKAAGTYRVRADGSDLVRIGEPSQLAQIDVLQLGDLQEEFLASYQSGGFSFSPDGRTVALQDIGPDRNGEPAFQVFTMDVRTGKRSLPLTRLPAPPPVLDPPVPCPGPLECGRPRPMTPPTFIGRGKIAYTRPDPKAPPTPGSPFYRASIWTMRQDGTRRKEVLGESALVFASTPEEHEQSRGGFVVLGGDGAGIATVPVEGTPINDPRGNDGIVEIFFIRGESVLELTAFGRADTFAQLLGADGRRVFFAASANVDGGNPTENCQLFSVDVFGKRPPRQLTCFGLGGSCMTDTSGISQLGCLPGPETAPTGCIVGPARQDRKTGMLIFDTSCDPFDGNPPGDETFAMWPDGSGLRQLTHTLGVVRNPDGTVREVELPGPAADEFSAR